MTENTLRYLKFDFQSHKDALVQRVRSRWPLAWNDFLNNSIGIVLIDIVAWSTATMAFMINRVAGEMFVSTMTLRESAVRIGSNFGYQLRGPVPAVVACEAVLPAPQTALVTIGKGTLIRTADSAALPFEVAQDYYVEPGSVSPQTIAAQIAPGLSTSNSLATLAIVTNGSPYVDLADTTIDLTQFVQPGQVFVVSGDTTEYTIDSMEAAPGAISNNRMVLTTLYAGDTGTVEATVYENRIELIQGLSITDNFVAPTVFSPNFAVKLSRAPVIEGSVSVLVNGQLWTQVDNPAGSSAADQVFVVKTFTTGDTVVQFGDNSFGAAVPTEAAIEVDYRVGGGIAGNVPLNSFNTTVTALIQDTSSPVTVAVTNQTAAGEGGRDAETLEEARVNIPYWVRTNDRAVTLDDYQTICQLYTSAAAGSVAYARATVRTENALLEGNIVSIYAWTTGSGGGLVPLSPELKQSVRDYMQTKAVGTDYVQILDGEAVPVPLSLRFKTFSGFSVSDTASLVQQTITNIINALRPGQTLIYSDLVRSLDGVYGVDKVNMATPIKDLAPANSLQLFTPPQPDFVYTLDRNGAGAPIYSQPDNATISLYEAQLPVAPVAAWSFRLFLGGNELTVLPGLLPGETLVLGPNLSTNPALDANNDLIYSSSVDLLTGKVSLWMVGAPGDLTMKLIPITGYSSERKVNVYVGYQGDNSQTKRREIRTAIRSWGDGLSVGGTLFGMPVAGVNSSLSCIKNVVQSVNGVDYVNRVALDTPANNVDRLNALDYELLVIANVILNNQID